MAESPMSDDSLSSIGASTEPLPASDGPFISPPSGSHPEPRSPPPPSRKQLSGGNESDSTLTEVSSSEGRGGGRDAEDDDEDDRDDEKSGAGEPTPKARPFKEAQVRRPLDDGLSDLSSANEDSEDEADVKPKGNVLKLSTNSPPRALIGELVARRNTSRPGSYSEIDQDDDLLVATLEEKAASSADEGDEDEVKRASTSKRGGKAARGTRGRGRGARGRGAKKAAPARRAESPLTSEDEDAEEKAPTEDAPAAVEVVVSPARGRGRGGKAARGGTRGGRGGRGGAKSASAAPAAPVVKSRSRTPEREASVHSTTSSTSRKRPREDDSTEPSISLDILPELPPLPDLTAADDSTRPDVSPNPSEEEEWASKNPADPSAAEPAEEPAAEADAMDVDAEETEVEPVPEPEVEAESEESSQVKKKPVKKGKKGGKGKEKAKDQDPEVDETGTPIVSDHEDADSDDAFLRKRAEAMEALTRIEIDFARLRDKLYIERMTEVEKERVGVETGTHPELIHLTKLIEMRRTRKLELAQKWLEGLEGAYERHKEEEEHAIWTYWATGRSELQMTMLDEANSKRRKLEREKRKMDRPKDDGLTPLLAPRPLPSIPLHHHRRLGFDGEYLTEADISWSLRHTDVRADPTVSALDDDSTLTDLERMGLREPDRHAGPYTFEQLYGPQFAQPAFADPRGVPAPFGYPTYDPAALGVPQHHFGGPFGNLPPSLPITAPRPPSNPRSSNFPKEMGGTAPGARAYGSNPFPDVYGQMDSGALHAPAWQKQSNGPFDEDRRRQRTPSASGGGLADSLDIVAGHKERVADGEGVKVNGHNTLKPRPSLDDHMAHARSPKAAKANGAAVERASFLSIPSIPPYRGPPSSTTTITASAPVNPASHINDPTAPAAPPQPQTTPLLGTMALKAAPTLFGGAPAEGAGAFAHFGSGVEGTATRAA